MSNQIAKIAAELIKIKGVDLPETRSELFKVVNFVNKRLKRIHGVYLKNLKINHKPALVVTFKPNYKTPKIFFNGHLDVVSSEASQFKSKIVGNKLFGRGAMDMKSGAAVMIALIEYFARESTKPDVGFMFVTDEEFHGGASGELANSGYRPKLLVAVEPTDLNLVVETKGIIWLEGTILGHSAHGSLPWLGENPLEQFNAALIKFYRKFPALKQERWQTTFNFGEVNCGNSFNMVPSTLKFKIDIRYIPTDKPEKIIAEVKKCFPAATKFNLVQLHKPHIKAKNMALINQLQKMAKKSGAPARLVRAPYCTDARFFSAKGVDSVVFGVCGQNMHGANEWADIKSVNKLFEVLKKFCLEL